MTQGIIFPNDTTSLKPLKKCLQHKVCTLILLSLNTFFISIKHLPKQSLIAKPQSINRLPTHSWISDWPHDVQLISLNKIDNSFHFEGVGSFKNIFSSMISLTQASSHCLIKASIKPDNLGKIHWLGHDKSRLFT